MGYYNNGKTISIDPLQTEFKFDGKTFENNKNGIRKLLQLAYQEGLNSFNLNGTVYEPLMRKLKNPQHWGPTVIGDGEMKKRYSATYY